MTERPHAVVRASAPDLLLKLRCGSIPTDPSSPLPKAGDGQPDRGSGPDATGHRHRPLRSRGLGGPSIRGCSWRSSWPMPAPALSAVVSCTYASEKSGNVATGERCRREVSLVVVGGPDDHRDDHRERQADHEYEPDLSHSHRRTPPKAGQRPNDARGAAHSTSATAITRSSVTASTCADDGSNTTSAPDDSTCSARPSTEPASAQRSAYPNRRAKRRTWAESHSGVGDDGSIQPSASIPLMPSIPCLWQAPAAEEQGRPSGGAEIEAMRASHRARRRLQPRMAAVA